MTGENWRTEAIQKLIKRIDETMKLLANVGVLNEMAVKMKIIKPFIDDLGWTLFDQEWESSHDDTRPDLVLTCEEVFLRTSQVVIEVKATNVPLESLEATKQLVGYAVRIGAPIFVMTNGIFWKFYLPAEPVEWDKKKYADIDIKAPNVKENAEQFVDLLHRECVRQSIAVERAKQIIEGSEDVRIRTAFDELIHKPTGALINAVIQAVIKEVQLKLPIRTPGEEVIRRVITTSKWAIEHTPPSSPPVPVVPDTFSVDTVHKNEQVNIVALSRGTQKLLCSNLHLNKYYLLLPAKGGPENGKNKFELSREGKLLESEIHNKFGKRLEGFQLKFVGKLYTSYSVRNNTVEFWNEIKEKGLFQLWDPENGPFKWFKTHQGYLQILRVYEIDRELKVTLVPPYWKPILEGGRQPVRGKPIKSDDQMKENDAKLRAILKKYGNL